MKPTLLVLILCSISSILSAQELKTLINKAKQTTTLNSKEGSQPEISAGLKEALANGVEKGITLLSAENGFWGNSLYKVVMPPDAQKVEKALRGIGLGAKVDEAILSMNRGAEEAVKKAAPIFTDAIKNMNITDALGILRGADTAATGYLRKNTSTSLAAAFRPVIEESLEKSGASKHWNSIMTNYNKISLQKVNSDLIGYVTDKAMQALFMQIAEQEKKIRKDPAERTSALLKTVFSKN
jgi:hypothetical protein